MEKRPEFQVATNEQDKEVEKGKGERMCGGGGMDQSMEQ